MSLSPVTTAVHLTLGLLHPIHEVLSSLRSSFSSHLQMKSHLSLPIEVSGPRGLQSPRDWGTQGEFSQQAIKMQSQVELGTKKVLRKGGSASPRAAVGRWSSEKWVQNLEGEQQWLPRSLYLACGTLAGLSGPTQYSNTEALASASSSPARPSSIPAFSPPSKHLEAIPQPKWPLDRQPCLLLKIPSVTSLPPASPVHPRSALSHP